ncbi:hypothetical protein [Pragia fontium]|uniref:Uncharacterized protein n=1 Tax=Pragia fontium DSM 5563 = ATCC 49100 TaxID=1122977 RepID=A0AAJ5BHU8_9GAMM|nr:hypothetical protein [Pragia fontium]SFD11022.1 hypothetical protein SAMN02745723_10825 [Pragia fontium DSM 5563 = ATCC 49100]SUB82853.1 Uncharacterised protein [Pragia fontium]VEJ55753.1 Uncharacterised protein [Pragia fontium]
MKDSILKPPLCVGNQYRRSDYGAPQALNSASRCYIPLISSRLSCCSPAASLLYVVSRQQVESTGEHGHVY